MSQKQLYRPFYSQSKTPHNKKYSVYVQGKKGLRLIHFGQIGYEQYKDQVSGRYKSYDHGDKKRRAAYRARHKNDRINDKNSAGYWAYHYLW
jgi:hypothetical protein